jgi:hypothetical protein
MIMAALVAPACLFAQTDSSRLVPAQMNAAGFINVGKIFADYGMLFDGGPLAEQLDQLVQMGMPDPRKEDLKEIAIAGTVENFSDDQLTMYVTRGPGHAPLAPRIAELLVKMGKATSEQDAYRGVEFYNLRNTDDQKLEAKIADLSETAAFGSFDKKELHNFAKMTVETASGANTSFGEKYGTQLSAGDYAAVSFEMPKELRKQLEQTQFNFLSLVVHARAKLTVSEGQIRLALSGDCMDDFDAEALKRALQKAFEELRKQVPGGDSEWAFILDSVQFGREGKTAQVSLALPEDLVKELLANLTGNRAD